MTRTALNPCVKCKVTPSTIVSFDSLPAFLSFGCNCKHITVCEDSAWEEQWNELAAEDNE